MVLHSNGILCNVPWNDVMTLELYCFVLGPAESNLLPRTVRASACQEHGSLHNRLDVVEKVKSNLKEPFIEMGVVYREDILDPI